MPRTPLIYHILQVDPLNENRCYGLRKDGMPCNNVVAIASRQSASSLLRQCTDLPSTSRQLRDNFKSSARLLLCKRWHQDQYTNVYCRWLRAWEAHEADVEYSSGSESEDEVVQTNNLRSTPRPLIGNVNINSVHVNSEQSAYEKLVLSILRSNISNDAKVAFLEGASGLNAGSTNSGTTRPRSASPPTRGFIEASNSVTTAASSRSRTVQAGPSVQPSNQLIRLPPTTTRSSSSTQPSVSTTRSSNTSSNSSNRPSTETAPVRHSHIECGICMDPYDDDDDEAFWECRQCLNRTHIECYREWRTAHPERTRCAYCRADVPAQS